MMKRWTWVGVGRGGRQEGLGGQQGCGWDIVCLKVARHICMGDMDREWADSVQGSL